MQSEENERRINLLDLSDDVLLIILSNLNTNDLISLSRTCSRLRRVTADKTLWVHVNYRLSTGKPPFLFLYKKLAFIHKNTHTINLIGKRRSSRIPYIHREGDTTSSSEEEDTEYLEFTFSAGFRERKKTGFEEDENTKIYPLEEYPNLLSENSNNVDRKWFRLQFLSAVADRTPDLKVLKLEYMRLYFAIHPIIPPWNSLTELSLRGSRLLAKTSSDFGPLYDLSAKLPNIVRLDLGNCRWVSSHTFMAISKFKRLRTLILDGCNNLGNGVAYTSFAASLGFHSIQVMDLRDTKFEDSELLSFKRNNTITKIILGKCIDGPEYEGECENNEGSCSGTSEGSSAEQPGCSGNRKRKRKTTLGTRWKRFRSLRNPEDALVIQVDLGLGIRVEHINDEDFIPLNDNEDGGIGTNVTDLGIASLGVEGLPALTDLVLAGSGPSITDKALEVLQKRVGLCYLDVRKTNVTEQGVIAFCNKRPDVIVKSNFGCKSSEILPA